MWTHLEEQVGGGADPLLEQHAQGAVLLLQVEHAGAQLQALLPEVLREKRESER